MTLVELELLYDQMFRRFRPFRSAGYPRPKLVITECLRGVAVAGRVDPWFSIPQRALSQCREFVVYYMAHELSHHAHGWLPHGKHMSRVERALMAHFGIGVRYWGKVAPEKAWYARTIFRLKTGKAICNERGYLIQDAPPS